MNTISILEGFMARKILVLFVLFAFLVFDWSCAIYSTYKVTAPELTPKETQGVGIASLVMKSGEKIVFSKEWLIVKDYVVGVRTGEEIRLNKIQRSDVKEFITDSIGRKKAAIMADGSVYWIISMTEDASGVLTVEYFTDTIAVPISDIESFEGRRIEIVWTILVNAIPVVLLAWGILVLTTKKLGLHPKY
jgi:hypothetical protein